MKLTCGNAAIRYLMFGFNLLFVISGIIILAVGVSVKAYYFQYDTFLDNTYFSLPNMLIATGSLIFFISFLGCYGAMKESWVMLMAFSVLLTIIFIFELSVGIAGYVLRDKTSSYLETKLTENMKKYTNSTAISNMWDLIQEEFECCGVFSYKDWYETFHNYSLPISCCPRKYGTIEVFYCNAYIPISTTPKPTDPTKPEDPTTTAVTTPEGETTPTNITTSNTSIQTDSPTTLPISDSTATSPVSDSNTTLPDSNSTVTTVSSETTELPIQQLLTTQKVFTDINTTIPSTATTYPPPSSTPYIAGCEAAFGSFVKKHAVYIGAVGLSLAFIQLMGIFFSFHLARQLKNGYYST